MRSLTLNIARTLKRSGEAACRSASLVKCASALPDPTPTRLLGRRRRRRWCWRRGRTAQRHPIDDCQQRRPDAPILTMLIGVFLKAHDRRNFAVVLATVEPVAHRLDQASNRLNAADGRRLESHFDVGVFAAETLEVDAPLRHPRKPLVGQLVDGGHRLTD